MLKIRNNIIYYIKRLPSGSIICRIPRNDDAELIASKVKTEQEIEQIIEEDSKCFIDCPTNV